MTKDKNIKTVVPALRFPEFRDAEGWSEKVIDKICKSFSGGTPKTTESNYYGGDIPFIRSAEINKESTELFLTEDGLINSAAKLVAKGDVLVALYGANSGDVAISKINGAINQAILCLKSKDCNQFLCQYLTLKKDDIISTYIQGGQGNLSGEIIKSLKFLFPTPKEQEKVADCLGSLDDLISAVTDKIEALKEHKKGLMQQLFPADGKTTPTLRFPEFQNTGEWNKKILSDVCKLVRGPFGGALKKEIFVEDGFAVYEQSHAIYGGMNAFRYYITEDKFNELIRFAVCPNDIIMSCSGTMGKFAVIPNSYEKGVINQALLKLSTKKGNDYRFIKLLLELPDNQEQLLSESAGGAIKNVASVGQIKEMSLCVPELKEQQKIADCLSSLDDLISVKTDKLDQLKAHKKGLMQQLFPTLNE